MIPHGKSILDSKIKIIHAYFDSLCISDLVKMIWTTVCELAKFITTLYAHGQYHFKYWRSIVHVFDWQIIHKDASNSTFEFELD